MYVPKHQIIEKATQKESSDKIRQRLDRISQDMDCSGYGLKKKCSAASLTLKIFKCVLVSFRMYKT
jgi:hypothetical protein